MHVANLLLHHGSSHVTRDQLAQVPVPPASDTWRPIALHTLLDGVSASLERAGLRVINESHGLTRDGSRYFGLLQVANGDGANANGEDFALVVGLRNSHDKTIPTLVSRPA
jgi:hypothetical protein